MAKVEREINKSQASRVVREQSAPADGAEAISRLLRNLQETEEMIWQRIESESLLISDLTELASVHRGKIELRMSRVDVHDAVVRAMRNCQPSLSEKQLEVSLHFGARFHHVRGDWNRLEQVASNLLKNAIAFTPSAGRVRLATRDAGNLVEIVITDNGVGIAPESLPNIFGAFDSGALDLDAAREGTSLQVCKALVELHGGKISVASQGLGTGATFLVSLPTVHGD